MASAQDLTGRWIGRYTYAAGNEPVPFEAELWQTGTTLEGRMTEPNTFRRDAGSELSAQIMGWVADGDVGFAKRYSGLSEKDHPEYAGSIFMSGNRIEGEWHFARKTWWKGTFFMSRQPRAGARAKRTAAVEI